MRPRCCAFRAAIGYEYSSTCRSSAPFENGGTLEHAYKEFRVLMPKVIHPYTKGEACTQCSLRGICDGFHKDYAEIFGFDEATSQDGRGGHASLPLRERSAEGGRGAGVRLGTCRRATSPPATRCLSQAVA